MNPYPERVANILPSCLPFKLNCLSLKFITHHFNMITVIQINSKMQAAAFSIARPLLPTLSPSKNFSQLVTSSPRQGCSIASRRGRFSTKATATTYDTSTVDYSSMLSVFPAEACETIGGDACRADIFPEVKLQSEARNNSPRTATELIDREYLEYNDAKTVFCAEACDDLGGEFCGREYQKGVY